MRRRLRRGGERLTCNEVRRRSGQSSMPRADVIGSLQGHSSCPKGRSGDIFYSHSWARYWFKSMSSQVFNPLNDRLAQRALWIAPIFECRISIVLKYTAHLYIGVEISHMDHFSYLADFYENRTVSGVDTRPTVFLAERTLAPGRA